MRNVVKVNNILAGGWRRRGNCTAIVLAATMGFATVAVSATTTQASASGPPTPAQISSLQQRANALAAKLSADQDNIQAAAEAYDEALIILAQDRARLRETRAQLAVLRTDVAAALANLRNTAVEAYVTDDGAAADLAVIDSNVSDAESIAAYAGSVTDQLREAEQALVAAKNRLVAKAAEETRQERRAEAEVATEARARNTAESETAQVTAILHEVKGRLSTLIIEHEQAVAAAAAARARRLEEERQAAAAAAAAAAAQQAANTAESVDGADPSPTNNQGSGATSGSAGDTGEGKPLVPAGTNPAGNEAVAAAESYLGVPYVWGGASRKGVDCSGLTMLAWQAAGVTLSHGATWQYGESTHISPSQIEPGDLIFYWFANDGPWPITHVAMYVGSGPYGTQTIIQAEEPGTNVGYFQMYWGGFVGMAQP
jgi:cell wall-associated NlpC family hydrolase